ncbi:titin-like [Pollicipes pollicipes]|uniref:titin-like n=1 Tax=Pollicipes pollicipes TaxID=41117 RepID=UPI0018859228|nr:titin-like [Pollicipes pollicipes]
MNEFFSSSSSITNPDYFDKKDTKHSEADSKSWKEGNTEYRSSTTKMEMSSSTISRKTTVVNGPGDQPPQPYPAQPATTSRSSSQTREATSSSLSTQKEIRESSEHAPGPVTRPVDTHDVQRDTSKQMSTTRVHDISSEMRTVKTDLDKPDNISRPTGVSAVIPVQIEHQPAVAPQDRTTKTESRYESKFTSITKSHEAPSPADHVPAQPVETAKPPASWKPVEYPSPNVVTDARDHTSTSTSTKTTSETKSEPSPIPRPIQAPEEAPAKTESKQTFMRTFRSTATTDEKPDVPTPIEKHKALPAQKPVKKIKQKPVEKVPLQSPEEVPWTAEHRKPRPKKHEVKLHAPAIPVTQPVSEVPIMSASPKPFTPLQKPDVPADQRDTNTSETTKWSIRDVHKPVVFQPLSPKPSEVLDLPTSDTMETSVRKTTATKEVKTESETKPLYPPAPVMPDIPVASQTEQQKRMEEKFFKKVVEHQESKELPEVPAPTPAPVYDAPRPVVGPQPQLKESPVISPAQAPKAPRTEQQKRMEETFRKKVIQNQESKELPEAPVPVPAPIYEAPPPAEQPAPQPKESPVVRDFRDSKHWEVKTFQTTKEAVAPVEASPVPSQTEQQKKMEQKFFKHLRETEERVPEAPAEVPAPEPTPPELRDIREFHSQQTHQTKTIITRTQEPTPVPEPIQPAYVEPVQAPEGPRTMKQEHRKQTFTKVTRHEESEEQPEKIEPKPAPIYDAPRPFVRPPSQPQESPTIRDFHDSTHKEFKTHKTTKETVVPVEAPVSVPSQTEQQRKMERKFLKQLQETEDRIPVSPVPEPVTKDVPDVHEYHAQQICKSKTITTTTQEPIPLPEPVKPVWVEPVQTPKAPQTLQQKRMEEKFVKKVIEHQESKELPDSVERTPAPIYDTPRPSARPLPQPKDSPVIQDFRESEHQQFKTFASTKETVAPAETPAPVPSQTMQQKVSELKLLKQVQEKDSFPDVPAPKPAPEPSPQEPQTVHELRTQHVQQSRTITTTTIQQPTPLPEPMKPVWVEPVEAPKAPQTEQQKRMEEKFMKKVIEHQESKELPEVPAPMPAPLYEAPRPVERSAPQPSEFPVVQDFHDFTHREFKSYTTSKETVVPTEAPAPVPSAIEQQKKMERKVLKQVQQTDEKVSETPAPAPAPKPAPPDTHDVREFHTQQTRQHKTITTTTQPTPSPEAVKPVEVPKAPQTEQRKRLEEQFLKKVIKHQESKELPEVPAPVPAPVHEAPRPAERPAPQPKTQPKETSKVESHFQHRYETSTTTQPTPKLPTGPSPTQPARVKPAEAPQKPQTEQQKRMEETFMKKVTKQQEFTHVPKQPDTTSVREEKDQKSRIRERERKPSLPESASDISDSDASLRIREIETKPLQADKYESYTSKVFIGPRVQEPPIYHKIVLEEDEKKKKKENIYETVIPFPSHFTPGPVSEAPQPAPVRKPSPSLVETVVKHVPAPKPAKKILPKTTHTVARPPASPPSAPMFTDKVPEPRHVDTKPAEAPKPAEVSKTPTKDKVQFTPTKFVPSHAEPTPVPVPEQETESPLTGLKHVESPKTARKPVPKAPAVPFPFENGDVPKTKPVSFAVPSIPKKETQVPIVEKIPRKVFSKPKSKDIPKPTQPVKHDMPSPKPAQVGPTQPDSKASSVQKWVTEVERATKDIKAQESPAPKAPQTEQQKRMEEKFMKKVIERQESKELPEVPAPKPVPLYEAPRPAERPVPQPKESPAIHDFRDSKHETFKTCTTTRETAVPVEAPAPVPSQTEQQKVMERKFLKQVQETETTHEAPAPLPAPKPMPQEVRDVRELHTQQIHQSKTVTTTTHEQTPLPEQVKPAWVEPVQAPKAPQTEQQKRMEEKFMTKVIQHQESKELPEVPAPMPAPLYEAPRPVQPPVPQPKESPVVHDFRDTTHHEFKTFTTTKETVAPTEAPAPVPSHTEQQKKMELKFLKKVQETEKIPEGPAQTPAPKPTPREVHDVQEFRTHQTQQSQTTTTKTHVPSPVPEPIKPVWVEPAQAPKAPQTEQQRRLEEKFMKKVIERQESKELPEVPVPMSAPVYDSPRPVERAVPAPKISKPLHTRPKLQKPAQPIPVSVPIAVPTEPLITPLVPQKATWQESIPSKPFQPVTAPRQTPRKDETVLKKYDDIAKTTRQTTREEEKRVFSPAPLPDHPALPQTTEITQSKLFASRTETVHVPEAPKSLPVPKKPAAPVPEKPTSGVRSTLERIEKQIKEDVVTQQPLPVITQPIQPKQTERTSQKFEGTMSSQSSSTWQTSSHVTGPEARPAPAPILPLTQPKHAVRQTVDESRRHELTQQKITSQPRPLGEDHPVVIRPQSEAPRPRQERTEQTETSRVFSEQTVTSSGRPDTAPVTRPERPLRQVPSMPHKMEVLPKAPETLQPYVDRHETFSSSRTSEKTDTGHKQTETAEKKGHEVQHSVTKTPTSRATRTVEQMSYQTMSQSVETSERGVPAVPAPKVIEMRPLEAPAPQRTTIEQTKSWQEMVDKVEKAASLEDQIVKQAPHKPVATPPSQRGWTTIEDKHQTEQITKKRSHGEQIIPIEMPPVSGKVSPLPSKLSQEQKEQLSESRHEVWQDVPSSPFSTPSVCRETTQKQSSRFEERKTDSSHVLNSRERIIPVAGAPQSSAPAPVHQSPLPASKRKEQQTVGQSFNTFEQTIQQPSSAPRETIVPVQLTSQNLQKHTESFSTRSSSSKLQEPLSTPRQDSPSQPVAPQDIPWPDEQIQRPTHVQPQQAPAPKPRAPPAQQRTETTSREERFQKSTSSSSSGPEHVIPVAVAPQADRAHAGKQSQTVSRQSLFEKSVTSSEDEHVIPAAVSPAFAPRQNATQSETRQSHFERSVTSGREHVVPMAIVPSAASPHPGEQTQMTSRQSLIDKSTSSSGQEHVVPTALATPTAAAPYADRQETSSHSKSRQSAGNQVTETETSERSSYSVHHSGSVPVTSQGRPGVTQRSTETRQEMHQSKSEHTGSQQQQAAPPRQVPAKTTSEKRQVMYETKTESASNKWGSQPGTPGCSDAGSDRRSLADSVKSWGSNKETTETNRRESTETGRGQVTKWGAGLFDGGRDMVSTAPRKEKSFVEQWDKDGKNERYQSMGYTSGSDFEQFEENGRSVQKAKEGKEAKKTDKKKEFSETEEMRPDGKYRIQKTVETRTEEEMTQSKQSETTRETLPEICR